MQITNIKTITNEIYNTNIVGHASCIINSTIAVNNITIRKNTNDNGLYIQMPQMRNSVTKQYQDIVFPITSEGRQKLNEDIISVFNSEKQIQQQVGICSDNINVNLYLKENPNTAVLANGTINIDNELVVKNVNVVMGKNGEPFMSLPNAYNKATKKSYSIVAPANREAYSKIKGIVLEYFTQVSKQSKRYYFAELDEHQIAIISENSNIRFDCVPSENNKFIVRFDIMCKPNIDNILNHIEDFQERR